MNIAVNTEPSVERTDSVRTEAVVVEEDKRTPDNSVPNVVITCTADDDLQSAADALQMIDTFNLPTADEVLFSQLFS